MSLLENLKQKIDGVWDNSDVYVCFIKIFKSLINEDLISQAGKLEEKYLIKYVEGYVIFLENHPSDERNLNFLREALIHIQRLMKRIPIMIEGTGVRGLLNFSLGNTTRGEIFECFNYLMEKLKKHSAYNSIPTFDTNNNSISLDLSYLDLTQDQLKNISKRTYLENLIFALVSLDKKPIVYSVNKINKNYFDAFIQMLLSFPKLKHLDLRGNRVGWLMDDQLRILADALSQLSYLESLNLSGNYIDDKGLKLLLAGVRKIRCLRKLDLSNNFIELTENAKSKRNQQKETERVNIVNITKEIVQYLVEMRSVGIEKIIISANYLTSFNKNATNQAKMFRYLSFIAKDPFITSARRVESILNPRYFIDNKTCLVTIGKKKWGEHSQIFLEKMDDQGQLYLMTYHLTLGCGCCNNPPGTVVAQKYDPSLFNRERSNYEFGEFELCDTSTVIKIEAEMLNRAVNNPIQKFSMFKAIFYKDYYNCIKWAMENFSKMIAKPDMGQCLIPIPSFHLHNRVDTFLRRHYDFPILQQDSTPERVMTNNALKTHL